MAIITPRSSTASAAAPSSVSSTPSTSQSTTHHDSLVTVRLSRASSSSPAAAKSRDKSGSISSLRHRASAVIGGTVLIETVPEENEAVADDASPTSDSDSSVSVDVLESDNGQQKFYDPEGKLEVPAGDHEQWTSSPSGIDNAGGAVVTPPSPTHRLSTELEKVNWEELQKSEDQESKEKDKESDNAVALLLARLEQENEKLTTNPKSVKVPVQAQSVEQASPTRRPRPPSMAQLRQMVSGPSPPALRYSMLPPPPMTDLEFYLALVRDYQQTVARLPTLVSSKIRKGVPAPLRGVVWQSMVGARDPALEEIYQKLLGESSPYEGMISKDLGRSFPGVDMFRDPAGDGQRMLARVLKCFSLYDQKIGYCQGLAFLVGPLLMHMPDSQAFCLLVRLMENYDLRLCFTPDLAGLHSRIFQFRELLRLDLPDLSAHLDKLEVDPASYVSQWFLSFFAVTCPLPMLFRIYDIILAEGATETLMRVALSVMRKNQARLLACHEMEDVMQLLLCRSLWDCYHYNADEFVQHFVLLSDLVTPEKLAALEQTYCESQASAALSTSTHAARASAVATAASRFLGRLWALSSPPPSKSPPQRSPMSPSSSATLSPAPAPQAAPPLSVTSRTASKLSVESGMYSPSTTSNASPAISLVSSTASTDATSLTRDSSSSAEEASPLSSSSSREPLVSHTKSASVSFVNSKEDNRSLHGQIEDLLTALGELQRKHAMLVNKLQREREARVSDKHVVYRLLNALQQPVHSKDDDAMAEHRTSQGGGGESGLIHGTYIGQLVISVQQQFKEDNNELTKPDRSSSSLMDRSQLLDELMDVKGQLSQEVAKSQEGQRRLLDLGQEVSSLKDQLRESHSHVRMVHQEKERLEKQVQNLRVKATNSSAQTPAQNTSSNSGWFSGLTSETSSSDSSGLRELKLGRTGSEPGQQQSSPSQTRAPSLALSLKSIGAKKSGNKDSDESSSPDHMSVHGREREALLLELAQAKTAEALARQEAEEAKQKFETLRKASLTPDALPALAKAAVPPMTVPTPSRTTSPTSPGVSPAPSVFSRLTGSTAVSSPASSLAMEKTEKPTAPAPANSNSNSSSGSVVSGVVGVFWGWRK